MMRMLSRSFLPLVVVGLILASVVAGSNVISIADYGAVPNVNTDAQAEMNSQALQIAFTFATRNSAKLGATSDNFWSEVSNFSDRSYQNESLFESEFDRSQSPRSYDPSSTVVVPATGTFYISYTPLK